MTDKIISLLSQSDIIVQKAFSLKPFSLINKTPVVTVAIKSENVVKEVFDEGERAVFEREAVIHVYTPKNLGVKFNKKTVQQVVRAVLPISSGIEVSKTDYNPTLRHFLTAITLTLPKTEE